MSTDTIPDSYIDETGKEWYSKRSYIHAQQTKARARAKAAQLRSPAPRQAIHRCAERLEGVAAVLAEHDAYVLDVEAEQILARSTFGLWWRR